MRALLRHLKNSNPSASRVWLALLAGKDSLLSSTVFRPIGSVRQHFSYWSRGFAPPAPTPYKMAVLLRHRVPDGVWIETGTFLGRTTAFLARRSPFVFTIEPSAELAQKAEKKLSRFPNVDVICDLSENVLPVILEREFEKLNFWLDGHYSAGKTFLGPAETPILEELAAIEKILPQLSKVTVFVDDMRCFDPVAGGEYSSYPHRSLLVAFSERNGLNWTIEHDIFVAWR